MHNKGFNAKVLAAQAHNIDHKLWQWEIEDAVSHRYSGLVNKTQAFLLIYLLLTQPACYSLA